MRYIVVMLGTDGTEHRSTRRTYEEAVSSAKSISNLGWNAWVELEEA